MRRKSVKILPGPGDTKCVKYDDVMKSDKNDFSIAEDMETYDYLDHSDIKKRTIQVFYTDLGHQSEDLRAIQPFHRYCQILHPNGRFRRIFDFVTVIWVLILVFIIPFEIGFSWYIAPKGQKLFLQLLDVWFAIDIIMNFRTGYIQHGTIVMSQRKIASHYLTSWFFVDLMGTFPFEEILQGDASSRKSLKLIKYFKIPKLLRVSRVMKYVRDHKYVYELIQVVVLVFTFLHLGACFWMLLLDPCGQSGDFFNVETCAQENVYSIYAEAYHLSASMILGISSYHIIGDSSALDMLTDRREKDRVKIYIMSTLYMVGGLFLIALLISEMNVYITAKMQGSAAFQRKLDRVTHEMEYYAIPQDLQREVKAFYDYIWIHQKQYDDKIALLSDKQMSTDLQRKLALHLFKDVVSHISMFSEIDDLLLGEICLSLRTKIFLPQDMILFKGDVGKELFIIGKGVVEVLRDDIPQSQRQINPPILLRNGSFFGEISLIMEIRRTCSVQARTVCEVNILEQRAFDSIIHRNPDFSRRMNELVVARQLERTFSRSKYSGIDVQVSKDDMNRAMSAVEKNMKEGIERRRRTGNSESKPISSDPAKLINECASNITIPNQKRIPLPTTSVAPQSRQNTKGENHIKDGKEKKPNESFCAMVSFANPNPCKRIVNSDEISNHGNSDDVSKVIDDIARRSLRFIDKDAIRESLKNRSYCQGTQEEGEESADDDGDDTVVESWSDGEVDTKRTPHRSSILQKRERQRGYRHSCDGAMLRNSIYGQIKDESIRIEDGDGEDAETMRVTGHFNPDRVVVDMNKVYPSILNSGHQARETVGDQILQLDGRLQMQDTLIRKLLSKLESIDENVWKTDGITPKEELSTSTGMVIDKEDTKLL